MTVIARGLSAKDPQLFLEVIPFGRGGLAWQLQPWALGSHLDSATS